MRGLGYLGLHTVDIHESAYSGLAVQEAIGVTSTVVASNSARNTTEILFKMNISCEFIALVPSLAER